MVTDANMKRLENNKEIQDILLATLIVTYPRVALRLILEEYGVSSAKVLDRTSKTHFLSPRSPDRTARDFYLCERPCIPTSLRCYSPFEGADSVIANVNMPQLWRAWEEFEYLVDVSQ
jgi:hypothetical protein